MNAATGRAILFFLCAASTLPLSGCGGTRQPETPEAVPNEKPESAMGTDDEDWKAKLGPEQYRVLRCQETERPFTGKFWDHHESGRYLCAGCGQELFDSGTKFDSGTGWPSFHSPATENSVAVRRDTSHGMNREEAVCSRCGGHLGHVFPDGPKPTGLRYCINSAALEFEKR